MSTMDEAPFRRALRWYPRSWRAANADALVGTLMDVAGDDGRTTPSPSERRDLRSRGVGARLDGILIEAVRDRVSAITLGVAAGLALVLGFGQWWAPFGFGPYPPPDHLIWQPLPFSALWMVALVAALLGRLVISRIAVVLTLPAAWLVTQVPADDFLYRPSVFSLVVFAGFALLTLIGRANRPRPVRPLLAISFGAGAVGLVAWLAIYHPFGNETLSFPRGSVLEFFVSPAGAVVAVVALGVAMVARHNLLAAALMVASAPWFAAAMAQHVGYNSVAWIGPAELALYWPVRIAASTVVSCLIVAFMLGMARVITHPDGPPEFASP